MFLIHLIPLDQILDIKTVVCFTVAGRAHCSNSVSLIRLFLQIMAWTNFIITLGASLFWLESDAFAAHRVHPVQARHFTPVGVGSVAYLMKSDVRRGSGLLKQNIKTIRGWLEEEGSQASKYAFAYL